MPIARLAMKKSKMPICIILGIFAYGVSYSEYIELTYFEMVKARGGAAEVNSCGDGKSERCPNESEPDVECSGTLKHWGYYCKDSFGGKYNKTCQTPPPECDKCAMNKKFTCQTWTRYAQYMLNESKERECIKWAEDAGDCGVNGITSTPFPKKTCE